MYKNTLWMINLLIKNKPLSFSDGRMLCGSFKKQQLNIIRIVLITLQQARQIEPDFCFPKFMKVLFHTTLHALSILVALLSKVYVCGCSIAGIVVSNPAGSTDVRLLCLFVYCVGNGLRDELIIHSEQSYRVCVFNGVWS